MPALAWAFVWVALLIGSVVFSHKEKPGNPDHPRVNEEHHEKN